MAISTGIANQPNGESYIVFDEDTRRHLEEEGVDYMYFIFPVEKLTDIPGQFRTLIEEKGNKHVFMKDTIEELCAQSGIDQAGLEETLDRYKGLYAAGDNMMSEFYGNPPTGGSAGAYFAMPFGFAAGDSACDYMEKHA